MARRSDGLFKREGSSVWYFRIGRRKYSTGCRNRVAARAVRDRAERAAVDPAYRAAHTATLQDGVTWTIREQQQKGRAAGTITFYESKSGHLLLDGAFPWDSEYLRRSWLAEVQVGQFVEEMRAADLPVQELDIDGRAVVYIGGNP